MGYLQLIILIFIFNVAFAQESLDNLPITMSRPPSHTDTEFLSENDLLLFSKIISFNQEVLRDFQLVFIFRDYKIMDTINLSLIRKEIDKKKIALCNFDSVAILNGVYYYRTLFGKRKLDSAKLLKDSLVIQRVKYGDDSIPFEKTFYLYDLNLKLNSEKTFDYWSKSPDSVEIKRIEYECQSANRYKKTTSHFNPWNESKRIYENYYDRNGCLIQEIYQSFNEDNKRNFIHRIDYEFDSKGRVVCLKSLGFKNEEIYFEYLNNQEIRTYLILNNQRISHTAYRME